MKYTIYADGASRGNPGPAAAGAVVYDESGTVVHEISECIGETTNNVAEYMAVLRSLEYLVDADGLDEVVFYLDSKLVVEQVSGNWKVKQEHLKILHADISQLLISATYAYRFEHVVREKNKEADALANAALDSM